MIIAIILFLLIVLFLWLFIAGADQSRIVGKNSNKKKNEERTVEKEHK